MLIFVFSALIVLTDQFFKHWIVLTHDIGEKTVLIPGFLSLFRLHNPGAAFGFLSGQPWWLLASIQFVAAVFLVMVILRYTEGFWGSLGLAAVLGGTIGNLIDRVFAGWGTDVAHHVVDMFRFTFIDFAIFNIADVFITLGFLAFLIHFIVVTFQSDKNKNALAEGADSENISPMTDAESAVVGTGDNQSPVATSPTPASEMTVASEPTAASEVASSEFVAAPIAVETPSVQQAVPAPQQVPAPQATPQQVPPQQVTASTPEQTASLSDVIPAENLPAGNLGGAVEPLDIFGDALQPNVPPLTSEGAFQSDAVPILEELATGPLPIIDKPLSEVDTIPADNIAPLLDHVYGGQYNVAQKADQPPTANTEPVVQADTDVLAQIEPTESTLSALSALETEIFGEGADDGYDVDKLLGEYGFESETDKDA